MNSKYICKHCKKGNFVSGEENYRCCWCNKENEIRRGNNFETNI
jgi:hypothetical protein